MQKLSEIHITLSEIIQTQRDECYMIPLIQGTSSRQTSGDREMQGCCQGLGEGSGELLSSLGEVSVWDDGKVLEWTVVWLHNSGNVLQAPDLCT